MQTAACQIDDIFSTKKSLYINDLLDEISFAPQPYPPAPRWPRAVD
jgi:hypothetical protein